MMPEHLEFACWTGRWGMHAPGVVTGDLPDPVENEVYPLPEGYEWAGSWKVVSGTYSSGSGMTRTLWKRTARRVVR